MSLQALDKSNHNRVLCLAAQVTDHPQLRYLPEEFSHNETFSSVLGIMLSI